MQVLKSVDREQLLKDIEETRKAMEEQHKLLKSLLSLKKMVDYRDGIALSKNRPQKGGKKMKALVEAIKKILMEHEGVSIAVEYLARRTGAPVQQVSEALQGNKDLFQHSEDGHYWRLADGDEEDYQDDDEEEE